MIAFLLLFAASSGYLAVYAAHCIRQHRTLAATGSLVLAALPVACAIVLIVAIA